MAGLLNKKNFYKLIAIRRLELKVSKTFNDFTGKNCRITVNDVTRMLLKERPKLMQEIDKIIEKLDSNEKE